MRGIITVVYSLLFSFPVAAFNFQTHHHASKYNFPFKDGFLASVWGSNSVIHGVGGKLKKRTLTLKKKYQNKKLKKGPLKVKLDFIRTTRKREHCRLYKENKEKKVLKAPTLFFLPGIFSDLANDMSLRMRRSMTKKGHHVITFPNPLSKDFLREAPTHLPGDLFNEAELLYQTMRNVYYQYYSKGYICDKVKLMGVSYGGFLTAIIAALDAREEDPIFNSTVTSVSPPYYFLRSIKRLDWWHPKLSKYRSMNLLWVAWKAWCLMSLKKQSQVDNDHLWDARGFFVEFFFWKEFKYALEIFEEKTGKLPVDKNELGKWLEQSNFEDYFREFSPFVYIRLKSNQGSLGYWLDEYERYSGKKIRVLTAMDDPLNHSSNWNPHIGEENVIVLPEGGHYGFRRIGWYEDFLQIAI